MRQDDEQDHGSEKIKAILACPEDRPERRVPLGELALS
jgi:hypothetical protein